VATENMICTRGAKELSDSCKLVVLSLYAASFIVFGFLVDTPEGILRGLIDIITTRGALLTDYIGIGGMGAAFVNAGLLALSASVVYYLSGTKITGASVACVVLVLGFGLFGKNLLNIWSIVIGVMLYSKYTNEPFSLHINTAFLGTALAPIFSEILFSPLLTLTVSLPLSIVTCLAIGFVLAPVAAQLFNVHMGFNLYNVGFTAGIIGTLVVALYKSYGYVPEPVMVWTSGNNVVLGWFLTAIFGSIIGLGFYLNPSVLSKMKGLMSIPGRSPTDFISLVGVDATLVNMGLCGIIGAVFVLLAGGDLNGPTIGAILTIVGFAAIGKHPKNIVPIMAGVILGSLAKPWAISDPSILLAALFGTTLAPIAGRFGWHWGIAAGFVHSSAALSVGDVHAGLNLYNSGFAGGVVAAVLVPIIKAVHRDTDRDRGTMPTEQARTPD